MYDIDETLGLDIVVCYPVSESPCPSTAPPAEPDRLILSVWPPLVQRVAGTGDAVSFLYPHTVSSALRNALFMALLLY